MTRQRDTAPDHDDDNIVRRDPRNVITMVDESGPLRADRWRPPVPGTVVGYLPAGRTNSGTVLLSIPIAVYEWYWMRWDDRTLPDGWVRGDVLRPSP